MDDLIDLIAKNESPSDIHSKIKDLLFAKASDNIETVKPAVTAVSYTHLTLPTTPYV